MSVVKEDNPEMSRQDLMREVGRMWKERKEEVVEVEVEVVEKKEKKKKRKERKRMKKKKNKKIVGEWELFFYLNNI